MHGGLWEPMNFISYHEWRKGVQDILHQHEADETCYTHSIIAEPFAHPPLTHKPSTSLNIRQLIVLHIDPSSRSLVVGAFLGGCLLVLG